ncbi:hypothetical protein DM02DRAFT_628780 [Periconia macrospinosa]|uniref:Uncharacterized protein n=1 Tax=Periconia macrospinosa TaxID=97972 RepID=A0A2V1DPJ2_9PLEO|nr:hypothetical protein DM02DRAFT_628780 [Periconia macrospinosa]
MREIKHYVRGSFKYTSTLFDNIYIDHHGEFVRVMSGQRHSDKCVKLLSPAAKSINNWVEPTTRQGSAEVTIRIVLLLKARERHKVLNPRCGFPDKDHTQILKMSVFDLEQLLWGLEIKASDWDVTGGHDEMRLKRDAVKRLETVCQAFLENQPAFEDPHSRIILGILFRTSTR